MHKSLSKMFSNSTMRVVAAMGALMAVVQPACWGIFHEPEAPNE